MPGIDLRHERVVVETDRYRVEGDITLPQGSYRNALADYINRSDQEFLLLTNVELVALDGSGESLQYPSLNLARKHIRLVVPIESPEG
mgnify:CR=1 FL=1